MASRFFGRMRHARCHADVSALASELVAHEVDDLGRADDKFVGASDVEARIQADVNDAGIAQCSP